MLKKRMASITPSLLLLSTAAFAGDMGPVPATAPSGFFVGLGGSYNSVYLKHRTSGNALGNFFLDGAIVSTNQTTFPLFGNPITETTFAPEVQAGYFHALNDSDWLWGAKFSYQYLGYHSPVTSNASVPAGAALTGFTAASASTALTHTSTINHEMLLLALLGHSFTNNQVYFGVGPSVFHRNSKFLNNTFFNLVDILNPSSINSSTFANTFNSTKWTWGGAAQVGVTHYFSPSWFIDFNYTYALTGTTRFNNSIFNATTIGDLSGANFGASALYNIESSQYIAVQSFGFTVNKLFNL